MSNRYPQHGLTLINSRKEQHHVITMITGRSTSSTDWKRKVERNEQHRCSADGCQMPRWRISGYCYRHARAKWQYGHPHGRFIKPSEYATETHEVSTFLDQHRSHAAVQAAVDFLT